MPAATPGTVVSISDIHFNPFYDPALIGSLIRSDYEQWQPIFSHSTVQNYGSHDADTNYLLFQSALQNIYSVAPRPDFIIISGDFLGHDFQETFAKLSGKNDANSVAAFIDKTIAFVTLMIARRFPNTPVYPALGNNDSYCGDYAVEPNGQFLRATAQTWKGLLRSAANVHSFMETFPASGSYDVVAPNNRKHRLIVLNTTFFSSKYRNACGDPNAQPGTELMKWLEAALQASATLGAKVWLLYHIPPGIDVYSSLNQSSSSQAQQAVSFWQASYNQQFIDLMTRYSGMIVGAFAGHTHMDTFQLVQSTNQTPVSFVHFTPAISPSFGNNPAFEIFTYNRRSATLRDYKAYYFDLSSAAAQKNARVKWRKEYSFVESYRQPSFAASSLKAIYDLMPANQNGNLTKYETYYNVSNRASPGFAPDNWRAYWCGMTNLTEPQYLGCITSKAGQ